MKPAVRFASRALAVALALAALVISLAFALLLVGDPGFESAPDLSPEALAAAGISFEQPYPPVGRDFRMPDGTRLAAQYFPATSGAPTTSVVLVHGLLSSSFLMNRTSGLLREAAGAASTEVVAIDLRGHGGSGGAPGDVDYVGQYEDDLGEVVRQLRAEHPAIRVILAGHSMGGGVALRYAERRGLPPVDGYLLFAPYLGWDSPTTRHEWSPEAAAAGAKFMKLHLARIVGLKVLDAVGVTAFDGLRVQFFNLPPELPLRSYTWRAMENAAPADYRTALAAVRAPLLVVAGTRDESFLAERYAGVLRAAGRGAVALVPDGTHEGVTTDARSMAAVSTWLGRS